MRTNTVCVAELRSQAKTLQLLAFTEIEVLGGAEYRSIARQVLGDSTVKLRFPFAGLNLFPLMPATKKATAELQRRARQ